MNIGGLLFLLLLVLALLVLDVGLWIRLRRPLRQKRKDGSPDHDDASGIDPRC